MKKIIFLIISFLIISCNQKKNITTTKPTIVVSIPPLELIVKEIVKDNFTIKVILPQGASPHTYEMIPSDIKILNSATMIFYVSDDLDAWICKYSANSNAKIIRTIDYIKGNYINYTNCGHTEHNHTHSTIDPHFWMSSMNVKSIIDSIVSAVSSEDVKNQKIYQYNADIFKLKLDSLHNEISKKFENKPKNITLFTAHNAFSYFTKEFGLKEFIAIEESPGKEVTTKYFLDIVKQIKKSNTKCLFSEPQINSKIIQALSNENNLKIILLDPLNSYIKKDSYCDFISHNANNICNEIN